VAVDIEVTAVGRNGVATLDEASAAARKLREFTRGELAAELGVKPIAVSRWLIQLVERKLVESATDERGLFYRATMEPLESEVFEPKPPRDDAPAQVHASVSVAEPDEAQKDDDDDIDWAKEGAVTAEEVRDWALMLERFTINHLANEMEVSWATAKRYVEMLVKQGIIVDNGWRGHRDAVVWEVRGEVEDHAARHRRRQTPVEREVLAKFGSAIHIERRGVTQALGELPRLSTDKDVNLLVAEAKAFGWPVEKRANHHVITPPGAERPIPIPSTPKGAGMVRVFRDQLRAAGLPDLGDPNSQGEDLHVERGKTIGDTSRTAKRRQADLSVAGRRRPGRTNKKRGSNRHGKR
jgi:Mn-dependent DtxR family transcriptional regulator